MFENKYKYISLYRIPKKEICTKKKNQLVEITTSVSKNKTHTYKGIIYKHTKNNFLTIQYKLFGEIVKHTFPIASKKIISMK